VPKDVIRKIEGAAGSEAEKQELFSAKKYWKLL
jgi:hypothetical protein